GFFWERFGPGAAGAREGRKALKLREKAAVFLLFFWFLMGVETGIFRSVFERVFGGFGCVWRVLFSRVFHILKCVWHLLGNTTYGVFYRKNPIYRRFAGGRLFFFYYFFCSFSEHFLSQETGRIGRKASAHQAYAVPGRQRLVSPTSFGAEKPVFKVPQPRDKLASTLFSPHAAAPCFPAEYASRERMTEPCSPSGVQAS
ncbi:hypothetical protein, partial [Kerstersia sp.]|uniref:hypothetical protein n=1 Tax=Kerstersia sp. TaxID=1930783 RepID=UPI003F8F1A0C